MSTDAVIHVLVVDDDIEIFELMTVLLAQSTRARYALQYVSNVLDVESTLAKDPVNIVLVDQNLGQSLNGLDLIAQCAKTHIPMVLVTSEDRDQLDFEALNAGAAGFILKQDLSTSVLDRTIRYALARYGRIRSLEEETATHRKLAFTDALTGLPNRREFDVRAQLAMAEAKAKDRDFGILYIDLNGFKRINDTHGHEAGDLLLQAVALRLQNEFRQHDVVCRLGGDEFVAIIGRYAESASLPELMDSLERRLKAAVAEPVTVADNELRVSASIGFALYPRDGLDAAALLKKADEHMFNQKRDISTPVSTA